MVQMTAGTRSAVVAGGESSVQDPAQPQGKGAHVALDPDHDPNAQQRKADFVAAKDQAGDLNAHALTPAASQ